MMNKKILILIIVLIIIIMGFRYLNNPEPLKEPPSNRISQDNLGLHVIWDKTDETRELGVSLIRGIYHFDSDEKALRNWIKIYQNAGLDVVLTLIPDDSKWGNSVINSFGSINIPGGEDISGFPSDTEAYKNELKNLIEGIDGDGINDYPELKYPIKNIQIGNEIFWQWYGNPPSVSNQQELYSWRTNHMNEILQSYGEFLKLSYNEIKSENPEMVVVMGNLIDHNKDITDNEKKILDGYSDYFDVIDIHFYGDSEELETWLISINKELSRQKSIWTLEIGGPMQIEPFTSEDLKRHAEEVVKMQTIVFEKGIDKSFWSSLIPTLGWPQSFLNTALLNKPPNYEKKPAYYTYKIFNNKINGFTSVNKIEQGEYFYKAEFDNKNPVFVLWSDSGIKTVDLSPYVSAQNVKITNIITGQEQTEPETETVSTNTISVSESPVFVEEK